MGKGRPRKRGTWHPPKTGIGTRANGDGHPNRRGTPRVPDGDGVGRLDFKGTRSVPLRRRPRKRGTRHPCQMGKGRPRKRGMRHPCQMGKGARANAERGIRARWERAPAQTWNEASAQDGDRYARERACGIRTVGARRACPTAMVSAVWISRARAACPYGVARANAERGIRARWGKVARANVECGIRARWERAPAQTRNAASVPDGKGRPRKRGTRHPPKTGIGTRANGHAASEP